MFMQPQRRGSSRFLYVTPPWGGISRSNELISRMSASLIGQLAD
jgi:hypothetical protein